MLFGKMFRNPNYCYGIQSSGVSNQLSKMRVVGAFQLIFN